MTPEQLRSALNKTVSTIRPGAVFSYHDLLVFGHIDGWNPEDIDRKVLARALDEVSERVPKRYGRHDWTVWRRRS